MYEYGYDGWCEFHCGTDVNTGESVICRALITDEQYDTLHFGNSMSIAWYWGLAVFIVSMIALVGVCLAFNYLCCRMPK